MGNSGTIKWMGVRPVKWVRGSSWRLKMLPPGKERCAGFATVQMDDGRTVIGRVTDVVRNRTSLGKKAWQIGQRVTVMNEYLELAHCSEGKTWWPTNFERLSLQAEVPHVCGRDCDYDEDRGCPIGDAGRD